MKKQKLDAIGYWCGGSEPEELPDPKALVRKDWGKGRPVAILSYLQKGSVYESWMGFPHCRFRCRATESNLFLLGTTCVTDGRFVWPEGLWHYVQDHDVMLPDEFLAHMEANNWQIPSGKLPTSEDSQMSYDFWIEWARGHGA